MGKSSRMVRVASLLLALCLAFGSTAFGATSAKANLEQQGESWQLRSIGTSEGNVDLLGRQWLGEKTREVCFRGFFGITDGACEERIFTKTSFNKGTFVVAPFVWPVGLVLGIVPVLVGDPMSEFFFPVSMSQNFDEAAFQKALDAALERDGGFAKVSALFAERDQLLAAAAAIDAGREAAIGELKQFSREMEEAARSSLRLKVVDHSGFWNGGTPELGTADVTFAAQGVKNEDYAATAKREGYRPAVVVEQRLMRAPSLSEYAALVASAAQYVEQTQAEDAAALAQMRESLARRSATVLPSDAGSLTSRLAREGYVATLKLPEQVQVEGGTVPGGIEGTLVITGRTFNQVLPRSYSYSNADLALNLSGDTVTVTNKTKTYISLDALTLYHQEDVLTLGGDSLKEISPGAITSIPLFNFGLGQLKTTYTGLTREKARATTVEFGFACKYRRNDLTQARSFVETKSYRLLDLLPLSKQVAQR